MKTKMIYENLDTGFVNLAALVRFLQKDFFIGRLKLEMSDYEAEIVFDEYRQMQVQEFERSSGRVSSGENALQRLFVRSRQEGGKINVYQFSAAEPEPQIPLPQIFTPTLPHRNGTNGNGSNHSHQTNHSNQTNSNTYPEIARQDISDSVLETSRREFAASENSLNSFRLPKFNKEKTSPPTANLPGSNGQPLERKQTFNNGQDFSTPNISTKPNIPERQELPIKPNIPERQDFPKPQTPVTPPLAKPVVTNSAPNFALPEIPSSSPVPLQNEFDEAVRVADQFLQSIEKSLFSAQINLMWEIRTAQAELADDYPFLDPSRGKFVYAQSKLKVSEKPIVKIFVAGFTACLRRTVEKVAKRPNFQEFRTTLALNLNETLRNNRAAVEKFGFLPHIERILNSLR